ncbi:MAG: glycosyltransferase [Rhodospirillales bacterium]|nr:glycosyltransferase [Rhodospirillales bacterium]
MTTAPAAPRTVLVYRDRLLPRSEHGFMRRQYLGFTRLAPVWIGCRRDPDLPGAGIDPMILGGDGPAGALRRALFKQAGMAPDLARLRALAPALVHAQFGRGGALALPLARRLGVPLVVTFHGGDAHKDVHYRTRPWPGVFARRLPALWAYASLFVCVSVSVRDKLIRRGFPPGKLTVLPIGVEPAPAAAPPPDPGHLLFVGRMVEKKGVFVLLDALSRLRASGDTTHAVLVGDGPLLPDLRKRAAAVGGVTLTGWQTPEQVRSWMEGALGLVVPSITGRGGDAEGLPTVAVEAMTLGVPLIGSDRAGLEGVFDADGPGLRVPAGNAAALAAAMARLTTDPAGRAVWAAAARTRALRDFDARRQSALLEATLLEFV